MSRHTHTKPYRYHKPVSPIEQYRRYGNRRPPAKTLESLFDRLSDNYGPDGLLAAAEVGLDLSFADKPSAGDWVRRSGKLLDSVIKNCEDYGDRRKTNAFRWARPILTQAYLRRTELENWRRAAQGEPLENNYPELRDVCAKVLPLAARDGKAASKLVEFMPVLLGSRLNYNDHSAGWFGRLALLREDCGVKMPDNMNPNWDVGIMFDGDAAELEEPTVRLQVKTRYNLHAQKYARAGIVSVAAQRLGFSNPSKVVAGCFVEIIYNKDMGNALEPLALTPTDLDVAAQGLRGSFGQTAGVAAAA